ncbi:MAG TPA: glycosyltransferase [Drouetiella sp.]|jgi:processive 1,2-diacylglycerol beta-glucosyltransferase
MFNRVLILSATSGAGHIRSAQAIEKAFLDAGAAREVRHVDSLEYTSYVVRNLYSKTYIDMVNKAPDLLGWLYDASDKPWKNERRRLAFDRLNTRPLVRMINDYKPEIVICTHFLPAEIISWLLCRKKIKTKHVIVVTDFDVHASWLCRHYDQYFTALEETREHLVSMGVPRDKVSVSGIPIDPIFAQPKSKIEMRKKYGLDLERPTILVSAGGFGVGPMEELLESLSHLKHHAQVIAMCGRNARLKEKLEQKWQDSSGNLFVKAVAHTTDMDEYMAASDMVLGKPGGLTTAEALSKGLVFVIVNPIPGQEERNSDHLLEEGVAIRCNNLPALAFKIDKLLDDEERVKRMHQAALRLARPRAAEALVYRLLALQAGSNFPEQEHTDPNHLCKTPRLGKIWKSGGALVLDGRLKFARKLLRGS